MNYSRQAIVLAIEHVAQRFGLRVHFANNVWSIMVGGQWHVASHHMAVQFDLQLQEADAELQQRNRRQQARNQAVAQLRTTGGQFVAAGQSAWNTGVATGNATGAAVEQIASAAANVTTSAYGAGQKIGQAILDGALRPFGASGEAVGRMAGQVTDAFGQLLSGGMNILSRGAGMAGRLVGGAAGLAVGGGAALVGAGIGAVVGGVAGAGAGVTIGASVGAAAAGALMHLIEGISSVVGGALDAVAQTIGVAGDLVAGALRGIFEILADVTSTASNYAKQVLAVSRETGMSLTSATTAVNTLAGLGIKSSAMSGLQQNGWVQGMRQSYYGVEGTVGSQEYNESFIKRYNELRSQGGYGQLIAQNMAESLGSKGLVEAADYSPEMRQRQYQRTETMQAAFGMNPEQIKEAGQNFSLLMASVSQFAEMVKVKIGSELFPYINSLLDGAIAYVSEHGDEIAGYIKQGVAAAIRYGIMLGRFLVNDLPHLIIRGLQFLVRGAMIVAQAAPVLFAAARERLQQLWQTITRIADAVARFAPILTAILGVLNLLRAANTVRNVVRAVVGRGAGGRAMREAGRLLGRHVVGPGLQWARTRALPALVRAGGTLVRAGGTLVRAGGTLVRAAAPMIGRGLVAVGRVAWPVAAGVALGGATYEGLRRVGILDRNRPPVLEAASNALGRFTHLYDRKRGWHLDNYDYHMDMQRQARETAQAQQAQQTAATQRAAQTQQNAAVPGQQTPAAQTPPVPGATPGAPGGNPLLNMAGLATPAEDNPVTARLRAMDQYLTQLDKEVDNNPTLVAMRQMLDELQKLNGEASKQTKHQAKTEEHTSTIGAIPDKLQAYTINRLEESRRGYALALARG